ncbi:hypothetical protein MBLNU457_6977t1 [Dothideomycetes sp. NU457]
MTSYVFEPVKLRWPNTDGKSHYEIFQSITANGGHTHLSFEEIRLARYALHPHPPLPPKQDTTESFLMPNSKFSHQQSTKFSFTGASGFEPASGDMPFIVSLNPASGEGSSPSSTTASDLQVTLPPSIITFTTASSAPFPQNMAALPCDWAPKPPTNSDSARRPQASHLPSVPPDVFILVEGEPEKYFQSITAWRDYAHLSFEEMRFAVYESQWMKTQAPCTACAASSQKAQDQDIVDSQSKPSTGPPTVTDECPWPPQWESQPWGTMSESTADQHKGIDIAKVRIVSGFSITQLGDELRTTVLEERDDSHGEHATADRDTPSAT